MGVISVAVIKVEYLLKFRRITGKREEEIAFNGNVTVEEVLEYLKKKYGIQFETEFANPSGDEISGTPTIILNGRSLKIPEELGQIIKDGDVITLTYPVFGG